MPSFFKATPPERLNFAETEREMLEFWAEADAFKEQLKRSKGKPEYTFYDGPPFATGLPHYGHILAGTIKDTVTRYAAQTGHFVERRFGWDCHGLPVEFEVDKKLGVETSEDVLKMGIDVYNGECRAIVQRYAKEWEKVVTRLGRWIDFANDYKTMEPWYMESVWWVFKEIHCKDLVYPGFRVMPYSTKLNTPMSNFEAGQAYETVEDVSCVVSFPIVGGDDDASFIAWTTTPWTLPSNLALCVNPTMEYLKVKDVARSKVFWIAKSRLSMLFQFNKKTGKLADPKSCEILDTKLGKELVGLKYEPLFDYFRSSSDDCNRFCVVADDFVTDDSGTGIVHIAPAFGEDDYRVSMANRVILKGGKLPCPVDANGFFTSEVSDFVGRHVKDNKTESIIKDAQGKKREPGIDDEICALLKSRNRLVSKSLYEHTYPFCYRSKTPLIYRAVPCWLIRVEKIKPDLVKNNAEHTYWVPSHVKERRFNNWLENARDWNVSRDRYWGTPLPIWTNEDQSEILVVGSIEELETLGKLEKGSITDLHREFVDGIEIVSSVSGNVLKRVPQVFDCWFESGSMPYAQLHYPFENKERFERDYFPADFIAEGLDQTRGWFYTLMVISTALFNKPAFKNLVVNGLVLAEDGKKMSKSLKNYPDPSLVIEKYGADALRLYLINSPVVRAEPLRFSEAGVFGVVREVLLKWYHAFRLFVQNARRFEEKHGYFDWAKQASKVKRSNVLDVWIASAFQALVKNVRKEMSLYKLYAVLPQLTSFVEDLSKWYVKLNRNRLAGKQSSSSSSSSSDSKNDTQQALCTLYCVLNSSAMLMAPFTPFFSEYLWKYLNPQAPKESVHFNDIPLVEVSLLDEVTNQRVSDMKTVVSLGRLVRERKEISVKKPLRTAVVVHQSTSVLANVKILEKYVKSELNVRNVELESDGSKWGVFSVALNAKILGKKLGKRFGVLNKKCKNLKPDQVLECLQGDKLILDDSTFESNEFSTKFEFSGDSTRYEAAVSPDGLFMVVLDLEIDDSLVSEGIAREISNKVQRLRKTSGVTVEDPIRVFVGLSGPLASKGYQALKEHSEMLSTIIRKPLEPYHGYFDKYHEGCAIELGRTVDTVHDGRITVTVVLTGPLVTIDVEKIDDDAVAKALGTLSSKWLSTEPRLKVIVDGGSELDCIAGVHYFPTS